MEQVEVRRDSREMAETQREGGGWERWGVKRETRERRENTSPPPLSLMLKL